MVEQHKKQLEKQLWNIANALRGNMSADEFRDYVLGFIFYKYLSERMHQYADYILKEEDSEEMRRFDSIDENTKKGKEYLKIIKKDSIDHLGYFLKPSELFHVIAEKGNNGEFIIESLIEVLNHIEQSTMGTASEDDFNGLFDDLDLTSNKLGKSEKAKNELISKVLGHLDEIDFCLDDTEIDVLGDAYEYLIGQFASGAGKKAGEFYTPPMVSKLLAKLVTNGKNQLKSIYDPTCGSGSLLLQVAKEIKSKGGEVANFYGQEKNPSTYNLARMNMILHGVHYRSFDIQQDDTLETPHHIEQRFEAVVANPPFSVEWSAKEGFKSDERFASYGKLAPKKKADLAFVQHMVFQLAEDGAMAVVLPHGALYRGAAESQIRRYLIENKNIIDTVITLPEKIFYGTSIPTCILVIKKNRNSKDNILFVNCSELYEKGVNQNRLLEEHITEIVNLVDSRVSIEGISEVSSLDFVINKNNCNLNIPRYIDIFGDEEQENICFLGQQQSELEKKLNKVNAELSYVCKELGVNDLSEAGILKKLFKGAVYFKDKNNEKFPNWKKIKVPELFDFITTNSFSRALMGSTEGVVKNIHYGDIHTKLPSHLNLKRNSLPFINSNVDITKIKEVNYCKEGDLVVADASEDYKDIGKAIELVNLDKSLVLAGLHTFLLRPKERCAIGFLGYCFQTYYVRKQMMRLATGVSVLGLSKSSLYEIELLLPCIEEQEKIVAFINLLAKKTQLTNSIVINSQKLQKGLLQNIFK